MVEKEKVVDSLFKLCSDRSLSSKDVTRKLCEEYQVPIIDTMEDVVRHYKQKGKDLENAALEIKHMLCRQLESKQNCSGSNCGSCTNPDCDPFKP